MKVNALKLVFFLLLLAKVFVSCTDQANQKVRNVREIDMTRISGDSMSMFPNNFSDVQFIPLENNPICMLGSCFKLVVSKNKFYVENYLGSKSTVLSFNTDGSFDRQYGEVGNGPNEYLNVFDFDIDEDGNVFILDRNLVYAYDRQGNFIEKYKLEREFFHLKSLPNGFAFATCHSHDLNVEDSLLYFYDKKFNLTDKLFSAEKQPAGWTSTLVHHPLQYDNDKLMYYDFFCNNLYLIDTQNDFNVCEFKPKFNNPCTYDEYIQDGKTKDCFSFVTFVEGKIFGWGTLNGMLSMYKYDVENNIFKGYVYGGFNGDLSYNDGYFYTILGADQILHPYLEFTRLCPDEIKKTLSPESNMVIVKMKLADNSPIAVPMSQHDEEDDDGKKIVINNGEILF